MCNEVSNLYVNANSFLQKVYPLNSGKTSPWTLTEETLVHHFHWFVTCDIHQLVCCRRCIILVSLIPKMWPFSIECCQDHLGNLIRSLNHGRESTSHLFNAVIEKLFCFIIYFLRVSVTFSHLSIGYKRCRYWPWFNHRTSVSIKSKPRKLTWLLWALNSYGKSGVGMFFTKISWSLSQMFSSLLDNFKSE